MATISMLLVNLVLVGLMWTHRPTEEDEPRPEMEPKNIIIRRLHFDGDQIQNYESLIQIHRNSIREFERKILENKNALYQNILNPNNSVADSLEQVIAAFTVQIENTNYHHFKDIQKLCRPDQMEDFKKLTTDLAEFFVNHNKMDRHSAKD